MNFSIVFLVVLIGSTGLSYDIEVDEIEDIICLPVPIINETLPEQNQITTPQIAYPEDWTCFDFAVNWSEQHPRWGIVVISNNPRFQLGHSENHFFNYQIMENGDLLIHDEFNNNEYLMKGEWWYDPVKFYHFYLDGKIPTRNYSYLLPNAEVFYNAI